MACDADRTELPPLKYKETYKIEGSVFERILLEVTISHPNSKSVDSTYLRIRNASGQLITGLEFFLESCPEDSSSLSACESDYHFILNPENPLEDKEEIVDKIGHHVNIKYANKIYITSLVKNSVPNSAFSGRYNHTNVTRIVKDLTDEREYQGTGKIYISVDGSIFFRGQVFDPQTNNATHLRISGSVFENGDVVMKDLSLIDNPSRYIYFGRLSEKTISISVQKSKNETERLNMTLK